MFFIQKGMFLYEWECSFLLIYNKFGAEKLFFDTHNKIFFIYAGSGKKKMARALAMLVLVLFVFFPQLPCTMKQRKLN